MMGKCETQMDSEHYHRKQKLLQQSHGLKRNGTQYFIYINSRDTLALYTKPFKLRIDQVIYNSQHQVT